jgi:hypothetical protein
MSDKGTGTGAKPYRVLKIDELMRPADTGGIERFYRHQIKTRGGTILTVDIDDRDFSADKAGPILEKRATDADKILTL